MRQILFSLLCLLSFSSLPAQPAEVVGYLPYYRFSLVDQLDFSPLTHLNLAFLNPDSQGTWSFAGVDPASVIQQARQEKPDLLVFASLAGGALTAEWAAAWQQGMQAGQRPAFIHSLLTYVTAHQLDGVDVDLEWSHVDDLYSPFVLELKDSLDARGLKMTAALPATYRYPEINGAALAAFERIHIMAYDKTGPWNPSQPGPHSPYSFAEQSIAYWLGQGVSSSRLTLGVPFYGYDFGSSPVQAFTFGSMVAIDTTYAYLDQVGQAYYNGIPTIEAKALLARQEVAGIMIWELGQDALGPYERWSLLKHLSQSLTASLPAGTPTGLRAYPNPFAEGLHLARVGSQAPLPWVLIDAQGRQILRGQLPAGVESERIPTAGLPAGLYVLRWQLGPQMAHQKLVKY